MKKSNTIAIAAIVTTIVIALFGFAGYSQDKQDSKIEGNTRDIAAIKVDIATIQSDVSYIKEDVRDMKLQNEKMKTEILEAIGDLKGSLNSEAAGREADSD